MDDVLAATQRDLFWVPAHVERLTRADVGALRDGSDSGLLNQVFRTSAAPERVPALVEELSGWHSGASRWLVVPGAHREALLRALPQQGYASTFEGDAWTLPTTASVSAGDVRVVRVHDRASLDDNLDAHERVFAADLSGLDRDRELAACTGPGARVARFVAYTADGAVAGSANLNAYPALGFGFLWAGGTVPGCRGRGVYRALLAARLLHARRSGLGRVGLYAKRDTSGPIVDALGFERHGPMAYWDRLG